MASLILVLLELKKKKKKKKKISLFLEALHIAWVNAGMTLRLCKYWKHSE